MSLVENIPAVSGVLVSELEQWSARGFIRFHGVDIDRVGGPAYMVESDTYGGARFLSEAAAYEFVLGLYAGHHPRFVVRSDSTQWTSAEAAA